MFSLRSKTNVQAQPFLYGMVRNIEMLKSYFVECIPKSCDVCCNKKNNGVGAREMNMSVFLQSRDI